MSHQTGIRANDSLKKFFGKCRDGKVRAFKISIVNEELALATYKESSGTWEDDYDKTVVPLVEDGQPTYILYRLDSKNSAGYEWLLISWSPDNSPIRQKMLYASTKATLKQEFGSGQIKEEIHATVPAEITLKGFIRHKQAAVAPAPLTTAEEELAELKRTEVNVGVSVDSRHQTLTGVAFPMSKEAEQALTAMANKTFNYVQLSIDLEEEKIHLAAAENVSIEKLPQKVPTNSARYHLFNFKHTHEGDYLETIVFIYSMPGYSCSIKERMLYSSCKGPLLDTIDREIGLLVEKKIEIDSGKELTTEFLYEEVHPKQNIHQVKFAKPKGPPNRGAKRLTRPQQSE